MRKLFSICRLIGVVIAVLMLASCSSSQYSANGKTSTPTDSSCHMWCHNGWCSKHCDDGDGN